MVFKKSMTLKNPSQVYSRLPTLKPMVQDVAPLHVSKVMCNHYRTQDMLSESSRRASRVIDASQETVLRVKETL